MKNRLIRASFVIFFLMIIVGLSLVGQVQAGPLTQQPTGVIPTVTSTPRGPYVIVNAIAANETQINVRAGPSVLTEKVGVLIVGQEANALGRYGDWVQIEYPGIPGGKAWIYGNYVSIFGGNLPLLEPPPTSTPNMTQTVDPTLAAQFLITPDSTRLPTFTEPPPLEIPTFTSEVNNGGVGGVPVGLIIVGLGSLGLFLGVIALISGR
ncbi:MAG: SH3 domain-containing protein [Brevefilum sp.]|nr:SH3 domain-containing protein [Brevefilum sp.]MDT8381206.1 SH3 domain-containing protein [Brevefilum sp.]MDW7754407.1 SH3 domain-containing protein [Brevefilum sp.]